MQSFVKVRAGQHPWNTARYQRSKTAGYRISKGNENSFCQRCLVKGSRIIKSNHTRRSFASDITILTAFSVTCMGYVLVSCFPHCVIFYKCTQSAQLFFSQLCHLMPFITKSTILKCLVAKRSFSSELGENLSLVWFTIDHEITLKIQIVVVRRWHFPKLSLDIRRISWYPVRSFCSLTPDSDLIENVNHTLWKAFLDHLISLQDSARSQKDVAIKEFQQQHYEKSIKIFRLALMLHPEDGSAWMKFKRSVESHQATAYFKLKRYEEALEVGETSYGSNPSYKFTVRENLLYTSPV